MAAIHGSRAEVAVGLRNTPRFAVDPGRSHALGGLSFLRCPKILTCPVAFTYAQVENPIPFSSSFLERTLTTGHLHARYAGLLLWPHPLSADWSFNCIPMLSSPTDPHNCLTAVLYGYLALTVVAARPWGVLVAWWRAAVRAAGGAQGETGGGGAGLGAGAGDVRLWAARWRLLVVGGLVVGPYFPASNVLFYVGTFIGRTTGEA